MGTKFANIHIQEDEVEVVKEALRLWNEHEGEKNSAVFNNLFGSLNIPSIMNKLLINNLGRCFIGSYRNGWFSVLHDNFSWENVKSIALEISEHISGAVLYIGYFDDNLFTFGIARKGKIVTEHVSGYSLEEYDLEEITGDAQKMIEELELDVQIDRLMEILNDNDLEQKVEELESLISLPLWIKADWIDDIEEESDLRKQWQEYSFK